MILSKITLTNQIGFYLDIFYYTRVNLKKLKWPDFLFQYTNQFHTLTFEVMLKIESDFE